MRNRNHNFLNRIASIFLTAIVSATLGVSVSAQKETPPPGGQPKPFVFPAQENFTLPNGMKVTLVQYGSVPKVAFTAYIYAGSKEDAPGKKGVSSMVANMLKEGTGKLTSEKISISAAEMGGSLNVGAGTDSSIVSGEVLSEFDARFLELLAEVVMNPNFKAEDFERLRANQLQNLAVASTQAQNQAWEKFRDLVFGSHPYGQVNPRVDEVKSYTLDEVKKYYNDNYGAAKTHLYIVGQFNAAKIKSTISNSFGKWKAGTPSKRSVPVVKGDKKFASIDRPGSPQSTIYLGMPAPNPADADYIKFVVMDSLLGGSFGSRITSNIRENKGYTYSPGSFIWNRFQTGYWIESADVTTQSTGASIKEILFEIERLKTEPVPEAELQGIKNYMAGIYVLQNSSRFGIIGQLETVNYHELPIGYVDNYVKNVLAVSADDIRDMAKRYLATDKMTLVVVGDKSKIADQLKPYELK
jgi:predicted Zn-dependent peptidase